SFGKIPVLLRHFHCLGREPQHAERAVTASPLHPSTRTRLWGPLAQGGQLRNQTAEIVFRVAAGPIDPAGHIVLAISVVVTVLTVADLIACEHKRHALREHKRCEQVAPRLASAGEDCRILARTFDPAIGAVIVVRAVAVILPVRLVVFLQVAREVGERKSIMHGDVVDARPGPASVVVAEVGRAGHAAAELADEIAFACPVAPQRAAEMVIPFRPSGRKAADLIAARPNIPRLGTELHAGKHRILPDRGEEGGGTTEAVGLAAERARQIEAESIDVTNLYP